jgi:hypothetical protein
LRKLGWVLLLLLQMIMPQQCLCAGVAGADMHAAAMPQAKTGHSIQAHNTLRQPYDSGCACVACCGMNDNILTAVDTGTWLLLLLAAVTVLPAALRHHLRTRWQAQRANTAAVQAVRPSAATAVSATAAADVAVNARQEGRQLSWRLGQRLSQPRVQLQCRFVTKNVTALNDGTAL